MNLKMTLLLVVAALVAGIVVYVNPFRQEEEKNPKMPWFYQVDMDDIEVIEVRYQDDRVRFVKTPEKTWAFEDPTGIPPSHRRWGGVTLLLSGPQTRRDLTATKTIIAAENRPQYGLDDPQTIVDVGITSDRWIQFRLGDKTTDGDYHYSEVIGFEELFLISSTWGDVLARLAYEPPVPKWYAKRTPEAIVEVNIYRGDLGDPDTPVLRFEQKDGEWLVRDFPKDREKRPVDSERLAELLPLFPGPPNISVAFPLVEDLDYTPYGITDDGNAIEIRFSGVTERGTRWIDGILLRIGSKSPDETGYYAKSESDFSREPVLLLPTEWTEKMFDLVDDIPYAQETASKATPQSN